MEGYFEKHIDMRVFTSITNEDTLIGFSLFTTDNAYNKFDFYLEGLTYTINYIKKKYPEYIIVVFTDVTSDELENIKSKNVKICNFNFPEFIDNVEKDTHIGMFGTLIRYLPIFLTNIKYKYYIVFDCDDVFSSIDGENIPINPNEISEHNEMLEMRFEMFNKFIKSDTKIHIMSLISANLFYRYYGMDTKLRTWLRITGQCFMIKTMKFPINILYEFLFNYINSPEYEKQLDVLANKTHNVYKIKPEHGKFIYGIDEVMLVFVMQYIENNKIPFVYTLIRSGNRYPLYYWLQNEANKKTKKILYEKLGIKSLNEYLKKYAGNRIEMYKNLLSVIGKGFFSNKIYNAILREIKYPDYFTYCIKYNYYT